MEEIAKHITIYTSHAAEIMAAAIIGIAVLKVSYDYILSMRPVLKKPTKETMRIRFGSSVAIALELLLGADVLATAVAPSWNDIGKLAAIAIIRTLLNYFLERELNHVKSPV
jgi:uncharacterized membrane protein